MAIQTSKYMLASERDELWGLTVTTIGREEIGPTDSYPTRGHADGYYFDLKQGRILPEYQLLYIIEGEGIFHSRTVPSARLKEGDFFLLFPGEWHSYHPTGPRGWKKYWIGFKGRNMDDRVRAGFLSPTKPIYHVGYNISMIDVAPDASLSSSRIDWTNYFVYVIETAVNGGTVDPDYTGHGLKDGDVALCELNEAIAAPGTEETVQAAKAAIEAGELHVFDTSKFTVGGQERHDRRLRRRRGI